MRVLLLANKHGFPLIRRYSPTNQRLYTVPLQWIVDLYDTGVDYTNEIHHDTYPAITASKCKQQGRPVLVSGASKGIGTAIAVAFAQAGASAIAIAARSSLDAVEGAVLDAAKATGRAAPKVLKLLLGVSDGENVASVACQIEQSFGHLDIHVNNAGRLEAWHSIGNSDPALWWNTWEVNLKGTYLITRAFLPLLLKGGEKTMININSIGAHLVRPGASAYQTSKLAILRLAEYLVVEYGAQGLLPIAVQPGAVATEMILSALPEKYHWNLTHTPELAADTIVWLTQERKDWLAGRYLSASWDMPEVMARKDEIVQGDKLKVKLVL